MAISELRTWTLASDGVHPFEVHELVCGGTHTLLLAGELDMAAAADVEAVLLACANDALRLTLDLSQLTFMDSSGLRLIVFAQQLCREKGAEFALIPGPRQVQRVFELTALVDRLPFHVEPTS
jgi:anti-anti-sigma factor